MAMEGGSYTESVHFAYIFGKQNGGEPVRRQRQGDLHHGRRWSTGVKQYVDLMQTDKVVNPSSAQYKNGPKAAGRLREEARPRCS